MTDRIDLKVHIHRIKYKYGDVFTLKPLFDIHAGTPAFDKRALKEFLSDSDDKTIFIGGGDTFDSILVQDKRYSKSSDSTVRDEIIDEQVEEVYEILWPYASQIVGMGIGNHETVVIKRAGTNPVKRLVQRFNRDGYPVEYLGKSALIKLMFRSRNGRTRSLVIRYHHGWGGGGRTEGGSLTKYAKDVKFYECDLALYGHDHKKMVYEISRFCIRGEKLVAKPIPIGLCGTFLKTFIIGDDSTYSEDAGYPPVAVGGIKFTLKPNRDWIKIKGYTE